MSNKTLPLLFINLGGEMLYILDQRLSAQNISKDKSDRVLQDITGTMFGPKFVEELFKPQDVYSKKALRTIFDRLAHASIMRLNTASMDKLYDLMTMAFKYQVSMCLRPQEILLVTLSHMDAIKEYVKSNKDVKGLVDSVYSLLGNNYANLSPGEFMLIKQSLLGFFQDVHIRVSLFLRDKKQLQNGRFVLPLSGPVPYGTDVPGTIKYINSSGNGVDRVVHFSCGGQYEPSKRQGSFDVTGDRCTGLGGNMYAGHKPSETTSSSGTSSVKKVRVDPDAPPDPMAKKQLDLLSSLIGGGGGEKRRSQNEFRLNLFNSDKEEEEALVMVKSPEGQSPETPTFNIDASQKQNSHLARIMGDLAIGDNSGKDDGDDLLALMDSAS